MRERDNNWVKKPIIWFILVIGTLCLSLITALDKYVQSHHNSDSVTHSLASHDTWTPFFWGQDRLGMLYSLLGAGIKDPVNNLLFLNVVFVLCVLVMFPLWGYWLTRSRVGFCGGLLASFIYAFLPGAREIFVSSVEHPEYAGALVLGFGGMIFLDAIQKPQITKKVWLEIIAGLILLMLAAWVNITIPIFLGGFFVLRWLVYRTRWQYLCIRLAILIFAFFSILIPTKLFAHTEMDTSLGIVGVSQWVKGYIALFENSIEEFQYLYFIIFVSLGIIPFLLVTKKGRQFIPSSFIVCMVGGAGFLGCLALLEHVGAPGFGNYRSCYSVVTVFALFLGSCIFLHRLLDYLVPNKWFILLGLPMAIGANVFYRGIPSKKEIVQTYENEWGWAVNVIIDNECTHIGGNSWYTYDLLFYTNYKLKMMGEERRVYPFTFRDTPLREDAMKHFKPGNKIACLYGYDWKIDYFHLNKRSGNIQVDPVVYHHKDHVNVHVFLPKEDK